MSMTAIRGITDQAQITLTDEQIEQFHREGYLGPLKMCEPDEMLSLHPEMQRIHETPMVGPDGPHSNATHNRHLDQRSIYDLSTHPAILERMKQIMGEDLLLWRTNFFTKYPGGKEIPWHQYLNYWPIEPAVVISALIAIDKTTTENSCIELIPGTHRRVVKHVKAHEDMAFPEMADPDVVDTSKAVQLEMEPGEFILFNERTMHHSEPNRSQLRRMALAVRVIIPCVRVLKYDSDNHGVVVISGQDKLGFNRHSDPPSA